MNYERPELLDKLSGAYVLGTMSARARRRFARLLAASPAAQRAVARWNNDLAPLNAAVVPMAPPPAVWDAIAAGTAAPAPARLRSRWRTLLDSWARPAIAFGLGIALTSVVVVTNAPMLGMHQVDAALPASYVGILANAHGDAALAVGSHRHGNTMKIKVLHPLAIPPDKVALLWALPSSGAPVPIGRVPASGEAMAHLDASAETLFANVPSLAVSIESDPAARTPALPYLLSGHCVKFW